MGRLQLIAITEDSMTLPQFSRSALFVVMLAGCSNSPSKSKDGDADSDIRKSFAALQTAIKERSGEKTWELLNSESRQDSDRVAKAIQESFTKAEASKKQELAKKVGLPEEALKDLTGKKLLESELFYRFDEHDELPEVNGVEKVDVKGSTAKVAFKDPDNPETTMQLSATREDGRWRFQVAIPKAPD
jgi:uncharacterized protein YdbL (DUF1318 family)